MSAQLSAAAFDEHPLPRELWPVATNRRTDVELAASPGLAIAEQTRLASHARMDVRFALASNPDIDNAVQRLLALDGLAATALAANPALCPDVQHMLLRMGFPLLSNAVVAHADLAPHLLRALLAGPTYRPALARNPRLPADAYLELLQHEDPEVRRGLAGNPAVDGQVLDALARDPRESVRCEAAGNPSLPVQLQRLLALDPASAVRRRLAASPLLGPDVQMMLARDPRTCLEIASNHTIDAAVVDWLLSSPASVGFGLASHPSLDLRQQMELLRTGGPTIRARLAANPCLHPGLQVRLCDDLHEEVLQQLARNPALVPPAQIRLAQLRDPSVRASLFANPGLDRAALRVLLDAVIAGDRGWLDGASPPVGPAVRWNRAYLDHPVRGPVVALLTGRAPLLDAAVRHGDPLVRWAVLCNQKVGADRLGALLGDREEVIRQAAQRMVVAGLAA